MYPFNLSQLKWQFQNTSFPEVDVLETMDLSEYGVYPVKSTPYPVYNILTHGVVENNPQLVDGEWVQTFVVYEKTDKEKENEVLTLINAMVVDVQQRLDKFAATRGYDGILSLCTYATSTVPQFQKEGQYGVEARDAAWHRLYQILAEVESGARPMPTSFADIEGELPVLKWPE